MIDFNFHQIHLNIYFTKSSYYLKLDSATIYQQQTKLYHGVVQCNRTPLIMFYSKVMAIQLIKNSNLYNIKIYHHVLI
jgi:hypothetical protein